MSTPEVVIYGASGYTGKLIAAYLGQKCIPFIAAGRNQQRLEEEMAKVPELSGAEYECIAVTHEREMLASLFDGKQVVYNVVGPFMQLGEPVVQAALDAKVHYLDTTGEQDWVLYLEEEYGPQFFEQGLLLCPACSFMWLLGQIAAELALETPGIDTLDIAYMADSNTSVASTMSFLRMCCRDQYYLKNNVLEVWPHTEAFLISLPGDHQVYKSLPWSGAAEPIWYRGHQRVSNCQVLVAFKDQAVMEWVIGRIQDWYDNYRELPRAEQETLLNDWGRGLVSEEPDREQPDVNRAMVSCHARGNTASRTVVLRGNAPYLQTGVFAAEAIRRILIGRVGAAGFASPCAAFGHRELIAALAEEGYLAWDSMSV